MDSRGIAAKKNDFDISYVQDVLGLAPKQIQNVNVLRDIRGGGGVKVNSVINLVIFY